jgi:ring-1,2-phenylacetyl-CoA epoxidase subunit PaaE
VDYKPGQYITLILNINGKEIRRPYSLTSYNKLDPYPFITVKKIENGEATRYLHEKIQIGNELTALYPTGRFVLPDNSFKQLFFMAAGSGISPIMGLIKQALYQQQANVILTYSNRSKEQTLFYHELALLQQQYPTRFEIIWLFSNNKNLAKARLNRFLLEDIVKKNANAPKEKILFFTCGPFVYMEMIEITLLTMGFTKEQMFKETFVEPEEDDENGLLDEEAKPTYVNSHVTLNMNGNLFSFQVNAPQTILQAALENNIPLPYSCQKGMCSSCAIQLTDGNVYLHYNQVLTDREVKSGRVLTCTAHPLTTTISISSQD